MSGTGPDVDGSTTAREDLDADADVDAAGGSPWADLGVEVAAGAAALAASFGAAGLTDGFVAAPVSAAVTAATPGAVITFAITVLGSLGQQLAFAGALALSVVALAAVASLGAAAVDAAVARLVDAAAVVDVNGTAVPVGAPLGAGVAVAALAVGLTRAPVPSAAAGAAAAAVVLLGRLSSTATAATRPTSGTPSSTPRSTDRRGLLRAGVGALAALGVGSLLGVRTGTVPTAASATGSGSGAGDGGDAEAVVTALLDAAADRSLDVDGLEPLNSEDHYQVDINSVDPTVAADEWTLSVTGAVDEERELTYEELTSLPAEHRFVSLRCVGEQLNGKKLDTALWTGVPVTEVLGGVPDDCCVMFRAEDDFFEEFPAAALEDAMLAYRMNGGPLPKGHGHPVRALVPGHWGEINVKWIDEIEILEEEQDGYWERRGWHGTGPVNTVAKLHAVDTDREDGRIEVGGHAYAGTRGVSRVEVSVDGGETWTDAELSEPLPGRVAADATEADLDLSTEATDAWRMWRHVYEASAEHEVVVRAVEADGTVQPEESTDAFPSGASGWVSRTVRP